MKNWKLKKRLYSFEDYLNQKDMLRIELEYRYQYNSYIFSHKNFNEYLNFMEEI
jgi:hypothetical protein